MSAIADIEQIQGILRRTHPQVRVDGDIGKITTAAVRDLQDDGDIRSVQGILSRTYCIPVDGIVGKITLGALALLDELGDQESLRLLRPLGEVHTVKASSFADPEDVRRYQAAKERGLSDSEAFKVGDNGIGKWGHFTAQETQPMAALPREVWRDAGKTGGDALWTRYNGKVVAGILGDTMPALENITNGAGMDWNPAFLKAYGMRAPILVGPVVWGWGKAPAA